MADPALTDPTMRNGFSRIVKVTALRGMTPNEMRQVRELAGIPLSQLLDDEHLDSMPEKTQLTVWVAMRRAGTPCSWEEAADYLPEAIEEEPVDPTNGVPSTPLPASVGSGG